MINEEVNWIGIECKKANGQQFSRTLHLYEFGIEVCHYAKLESGNTQVSRFVVKPGNPEYSMYESLFEHLTLMGMINSGKRL